MTNTETKLISIVNSKSKSGKALRVAVIPQEMAPGLECHHEASRLAAAAGCRAWRVVTAAGVVLAAGSVNPAASYGSFGPGESL